MPKTQQNVEELDEAEVFKVLYQIEHYYDSLNIVWYAILAGTEYLQYLLNSPIFQKTPSYSASKLLNQKFEEDNGDIPVGYITKWFSIDDLKIFLDSSIFSRMDNSGRFLQYNISNDNSKTLLDLALEKSPEHLALLLNCDNCLAKFAPDQRLVIMSSEASPILYKAFYIGNGYPEVILNSDVIASMPQEHKAKLIYDTLHYSTGIIGPQPDPYITEIPDNLHLLKASKVFMSLNQNIQQKLLFGEYIEGAGVEYEL